MSLQAIMELCALRWSWLGVPASQMLYLQGLLVLQICSKQLAVACAVALTQANGGAQYTGQS